MLVLRVRVAPKPTSYGTETTVSARTAAGASCTVAVRYASGHTATSRSLKATETADSGGQVSWTWRVSTRTPGQASATVTCSLAGRNGTGVARFAVR